MSNKKALIIGVGLACANVVASIRQHKPSVIYFLCSKTSRKIIDGKGAVCKENYKSPENTLPNVLAQCGITPPFPVEIYELGNADDLSECLNTSLDAFYHIKRTYSDHEVVIDFTPGTKSMTIGMFSASQVLDHAIISPMTGIREDEYTVTPGTEFLSTFSRNAVIEAWHFRILDRYVNRFDYASAIAYIEYLTLSERGLDSRLRERLHRYSTWCKAFEAWDRFEHPRAWNLFVAMKAFADKQQYCLFLKSANCGLAALNPDVEDIGSVGKAGGYECVEDLLFNAERRRLNGRYDDAVARLYRALELLMQVRLKREYGIDTARIALMELPDEIRTQFKDEKDLVRISLVQGYELLMSRGDALGKAFQESKSSILTSLEIRNHSILAHGAIAIREKEYDVIDQNIGWFIQRQLTVLNTGKSLARQFPDHFVVQ